MKLTHRVSGFTSSATARLVGRVVDQPKAMGEDGLVRMYLETGPESMGGLHEVLAEGAVADFCLRHGGAGAWVQLQGGLRSDTEQREDGSWRWRSTVFADRMRRLPESPAPSPFNEVVVYGYTCTDIEVCRPFSNQIHPFWLEAIERVYVEIDGPEGEEHVLVALSDDLGPHAKHRFVVGWLQIHCDTTDSGTHMLCTHSVVRSRTSIACLHAHSTSPRPQPLHACSSMYRQSSSGGRSPTSSTKTVPIPCSYLPTLLPAMSRHWTHFSLGAATLSPRGFRAR